MPEYKFTITCTGNKSATSTVTVTGPYAHADACILANAYRDALGNSATVTIPVDTARADGQQQAANRELGAHPV